MGEHGVTVAVVDTPTACGEPVEPVGPQGPPVSVLPILSRALAAALLAYVLINFVLISGNAIVGFPIQHDDFTNLSHTSIDLHRAWARPVSTIILMALSMAGPTVFFVTLHVLTVSYVALALSFVAVLFRVRRPPFALLLALAAPAFAFEYIVYYYRYTGLITNLLSTTFGTISLLMLLTGLREARRPGLKVGVGVLAFVLSVLSKEDVILPGVLLCAYLALPGVATSRRRRLAALVLTAALGVTAAAWLLYSTMIVHSAFLGMASGTYERVLAPASLLATVVWYLKATAGVKTVAALQAFGLLVGLSFGLRRHWRELVLAQVIPLALIFAYAPLPHHVNPYYCFNWLPWQTGCLMVAGRLTALFPRRITRAGVLAALLALAAIPVVVTQRQRRAAIEWYSTEISVNRNIVNTLLTNRRVINAAQRVAILTAPAHNPWFGTDGSFLANRYGLHPHWLVLVPRDGDYYRSVLRLLGRLQVGAVETADIGELDRLPRMPVIRFDPEGRGALTWSTPQRPKAPVEGSMSADPNPIKVCDGTGVGITTISWRVPKGNPIEIRMGSTTGTVFVRQSVAQGSAITGKWVSDGTRFVLLDAESRETLAILTVRVTSVGCR